MFGRQEHLPDIAEDVFIIEVHGRPETSEKHFFASLDKKDVNIDENLDRLPNQNVPVKSQFKLEKQEAKPVSEVELSEKMNEVLAEEKV